MKSKYLTLTFLLLVLSLPKAFGQETHSSPAMDEILVDDKLLIDRYTERYSQLDKTDIYATIENEATSPFQTAAALRVLKQQFIPEAISKEKNYIERLLLRCLNRTESAFVEVEAMHALVILDRYKYFKSLVPALIRKLDHYNDAVSSLAFDSLDKIIQDNTHRAREAKIIFSTMRKILFLSRNRLVLVKEPSNKLKQKLTLLRWSIKVLGTQMLDQLPPEVIRLL